MFTLIKTIDVLYLSLLKFIFIFKQSKDNYCNLCKIISHPNQFVLTINYLASTREHDKNTI